MCILWLWFLTWLKYKLWEGAWVWTWIEVMTPELARKLWWCKLATWKILISWFKKHQNDSKCVKDNNLSVLKATGVSSYRLRHAPLAQRSAPQGGKQVDGREGRRRGMGKGRCLSGWRTLQQGCSIVDWLVGDHFVSGADAPRVSQPVQMLDVTPAIIPHLRQI